MVRRTGLEKDMNNLLLSRKLLIISVFLLILIAGIIFLLNPNELGEKNERKSTSGKSRIRDSKLHDSDDRRLQRTRLEKLNAITVLDDSIENLISNIDRPQSEYLFLADDELKVTSFVSSISIHNFPNVFKLIKKGDSSVEKIGQALFRETNERRLSLLCYVILKIKENDIEYLEELSNLSLDDEQASRIRKASSTALLW